MLRSITLSIYSAAKPTGDDCKNFVNRPHAEKLVTNCGVCQKRPKVHRISKYYKNNSWADLKTVFLFRKCYDFNMLSH